MNKWTFSKAAFKKQVKLLYKNDKNKPYILYLL